MGSLERLEAGVESLWAKVRISTQKDKEACGNLRAVETLEKSQSQSDFPSLPAAAWKTLRPKRSEFPTVPNRPDAVGGSP
jgi:hypothetical protein